MLGELDPNEQARLYYGSDLWETPKSENVEKGVEANFNLKLAFSIEVKLLKLIHLQDHQVIPQQILHQANHQVLLHQANRQMALHRSDTSQSSPGSSTQGQQPNGATSSETQNPAGNGQQGQRN